jgi:tungstate transport system ATP-binding protein
MRLRPPACRARSALPASTSSPPPSALPGSAAGRRESSPAASSSGWPTASLDPAATKAIEDVIRVVAARGIKVVMSTHDLGEARRLAGEIVLMHRGRVIESGAADTFFADPRTEEARRFMRGELLV